MVTSEVTRAAASVGDSNVLGWGARAGYLVSAIVHLLIGLLGLQVAFGVSLGLLAVWQLTEVVSRRETSERVKAAGKMIGYAALALTAVGVFQGTRQSSVESTQQATRTLLSLPFGQALVAAVGLAVVAIGVYHVVKGVRSRFLRDLVEHPPAAVVWAGRLGYAAKGLALAASGGLIVVAAVNRRPDEARGLDGALRAFLDLPFGNAVRAKLARL